MAALTGDTRTIDLGNGFSIQAPGLIGTVQILPPRAPGTRGAQLATGALDDALRSTGVGESADVELKVASTPFPANAQPMRGPNGTDAFEFRAPDPGPDKGQVVLSLDEAGAMRWHFPVNDDLTLQPSAVRGAGAQKVYRIPSAIGRAPAEGEGGQRGLFAAVGKKLLKVLVYPIADTVLGPLTDRAVSAWEEKKRPHSLKNHLPDDRSPIAPGDWARLTSGRSLLLVHGTFSTAKAGFSGLEGDTLKALAAKYDNRIFAFDHPSISVSPVENARWFFSELPAGHNLDVDIVCHSRGGLVSRTLAGWPGGFTHDPGRFAREPGFFKVGKLVLVGVPNDGTPLAKPDHMVEFLDRMTTALNVFPDIFITDLLEGILTVVKVIGHAGLKALDGLAAMRPGNEFLAELGRSRLPASVFGIGGDYEPKFDGLSAAFCLAADALVDRIFENSENDLVVPHAGMKAWTGGAVPAGNFLDFAPKSGILHTNYFTHKNSRDKLLSWLG